MSASRIAIAGQGLDLVTFVIAVGLVGVPIMAESNPLFARGYEFGGFLAVAALKIAFAAAMLALMARLRPENVVVGTVIVLVGGLIGTASNVWTSLVWLDLQGFVQI